jgi:hypothetical protein
MTPKTLNNTIPPITQANITVKDCELTPSVGTGVGGIGSGITGAKANTLTFN